MDTPQHDSADIAYLATCCALLGAALALVGAAVAAHFLCSSSNLPWALAGAAGILGLCTSITAQIWRRTRRHLWSSAKPGVR